MTDDLSSQEVGEEVNSILTRAECLRLSNHGRERLDRLYDRMTWLYERIEEGEAKGRDFTFDKAEASALQFAIQYMEDGDTIYHLLAKWMDEENDKH